MATLTDLQKNTITQYVAEVIERSNGDAALIAMMESVLQEAYDLADNETASFIEHGMELNGEEACNHEAVGSAARRSSELNNLETYFYG